MPKVFLIRHTETFDNQDHVFSGRRDVRLTEKGIRQAEELCELLSSEEIGMSFSSPLLRSRETLEIILRAHQKTKICIDPRIIERSYGMLQGSKKETLANLSLFLFKRIHRGYWIAPPGGESLHTVKQRVKPFLKDLVETGLKRQKNIAICAHGNSMRLLRIFFEKRPHSEFNMIETSVGQLFTYDLSESDLDRLTSYL